MVPDKRWTILRPDYVDADHPPVLAVDPGKATGIAYLGPPLGPTKDHDGFLAEEPYLRALDTCSDVMDKVGPGLVVVTEKFTITNKTGSNTQAPWSLKSNGVLEWLAHLNGLTYTEQQPSLAKRGASKDRLRHAGWYVPTPDGHAADAASHLYVRLVQLRLLSPPTAMELEAV